MQATVIGIAGGSGSGKSTLARLVRDGVSRPSTALSFDSYYKDQRHMAPEDRRRVNYDHPNSLDVDRFAEDLAALKAGLSVATPVYDFEADTRSEDIHVVEPAPIVVVEGILLFVFDHICELVDVKVFVDVPDSVRTQRRVERDVAERGRTFEYSMSQIERTVRPMYGEFVRPSMDRADMVIDGTVDPQVSAHRVFEHIELSVT